MKTRRTRKTRMAQPALLAAALVSIVGGVAQAHDDLAPAIEQAADPAATARGPGRWRVSVGGRSSLYRSAGYDAFSSDDAFGQFSATATATVLAGARLSTAVGALWEDGASSSTARGAESSLSLGRLGVVLEERFAPRPWAYAFLRVAPAWLRGKASIDDTAIAAPLETTFSTLGVDGSVGVAGRVNPGRGKVGVWIMGDGGYGWARAQPMALSPALPSADRDKAGVTTLAALAPSGVFLRFSLALSY
jgi:hypothetical protein